MKKLFIYIVAAGLFTACTNSNSQEQTGGITISGTVINPPAGVIVLEKLNRTAAEPMDTIELAGDNTFSHKFFGEAGYYRINFYNNKAATIILDKNDIVIDYDGSNGTITPSGSSEMTQIEEFYKTVGEEFGPREQAINNDFVAANQAGDAVKAEAARDAYMALQDEKQVFYADLIRNSEVNLATFQLLSVLDKDKQLELKDSLARVLNDRYPGRFYIEDLVTTMEKARTTAVGNLAPEISLPNPDGEIVPLSSLRGKVVLVDFWAQWCKPCRQENPNVVAAYKKYKDKGFTVYGVSLDRTRENWLRAIEEDGLTWTHVSDLKYFSSVAAQTYGVEGIPFSILLDREGRILAKNLRGKVLDDTLEDFFAKEAAK